MILLESTFSCASPHVTPIWLSHRARRGFLHGISSLFCFLHLRRWIGSSDTQPVAFAHVTKCPLWLASIIWHSSLCFYNKPYMFDAGIMLHHATSCYITRHHATSLFGSCAAPDTLCQSFWSSSALLVRDTRNRSRVLPSLGSCR